MKRTNVKQLVVGMSVAIMSGCGAFDIHPYDVKVKGDTDINAKNIARIEEATQGKDTLRFACISRSAAGADNL